MRTVVIGDIGGHFTVLTRILDQLVVSGDRLPANVQVIQVGDLVRAGERFRESNTAIMSRMQSILRRNPNWIQLLGNHECAALGGPAKGDWDVEASFDEECRSILRSLWDSGRIRLAASERGALITHAGLTRGHWSVLGSPAAAEAACDMLNRGVGQQMADICRPGRLVTDAVTADADILWAEVNTELLAPWLAGQDMPFDQIHGHASPFRWNTGQWWADASAKVRQATQADVTLRRSQTQIQGTQRTLTSVDWVLEDIEPECLWPLLTLPGGKTW